MTTNQLPKKHLIEASLSLIEKKGWADFSLMDLCNSLAIEPPDLHQHISNKSQWLVYWQTYVVEEIQNIIPQEDLLDLSIKDRLLELTMTRFEVLSPHRPALKVLFEGLVKEPQNYLQFQSALRQGWEMLFTYGHIPNTSVISRIRTEAFISLYLVNLYRWLHTDLSAEKLQSTLDQQLGWGDKIMQPYT